MSGETKSEVIICGAGASGLATALQILRLSPDTTIRLIDPNFTNSPRKTWCFWDESVAPKPDLISKSWTKISVIDSQSIHTEEFESPIYFCIHSDEYRRKLISELKSSEKTTLLEDTVTRITSANEVLTSQGCMLSADYVVDSRFHSIDDIPFHPSSNTLWQHFKGWVIETQDPIFDADHAILMDFRVPQSIGFAFVYLLPYSKTKALVELTYFNNAIPPKNHYDPILKAYLEEYWDLTQSHNTSKTTYSVQDIEYGIIPMTDLPISLSKSGYMVKTGLSGGLAKASTGYAFSRSQRHALKLAKQLSQKLPMKNWTSPARFQYYDMLILHLLKTDPNHCVQIFMDLFGKNGFKLVFDFLDEKTNLADELKIMSSVPSYMAFFKSIRDTRSKVEFLK